MDIISSSVLGGKGMTVDNFIKNYKSSNNKEQFWKKHITTTYIPVLKKQAYSTIIADKGNHITVGDRTTFKSQSLVTYISFTMRLIDLYTDIDVKFKDGEFVNQYDELNKNGLINEIVAAIPESEYKEFKTILQMETDDLYQNEYSVPALLYSIKESLSMSSEVMSKALDNIDLSALQKTE